MELFLHSASCYAGGTEEARLYDRLERAFVNWALNFSLWQLNTMQGEVFPKTYNLLKKEGFDSWTLRGMTEAIFIIRRNTSSF